MQQPVACDEHVAGAEGPHQCGPVAGAETVHRERGREAVEFVFPVVADGCGRNDDRRPHLGLRQQHGDGLHGLAEPHIVRKTGPRAPAGQPGHPDIAVKLVVAQLRPQRRRHGGRTAGQPDAAKPAFPCGVALDLRPVKQIAHRIRRQRMHPEACAVASRSSRSSCCRNCLVRARNAPSPRGTKRPFDCARRSSTCAISSTRDSLTAICPCSWNQSREWRTSTVSRAVETCGQTRSFSPSGHSSSGPACSSSRRQSKASSISSMHHGPMPPRSRKVGQARTRALAAWISSSKSRSARTARPSTSANGATGPSPTGNAGVPGIPNGRTCNAASMPVPRGRRRTSSRTDADTSSARMTGRTTSSSRFLISSNTLGPPSVGTLSPCSPSRSAVPSRRPGR